jgi:hypothetical protein
MEMSMNNRERKLDQLADRLVNQEVYYCASSLMNSIGKIMWDCDAFQKEFGYPDDYIGLFTKDDWETPGDWFIMEDADLADLEKIANEYGDFDELLKALGVPDSIALPTHWVCSDCILPLVNDDYTAAPEDKVDELESAVQSFDGGEYLGEEYDEEFSNRTCDCCGTSLAGERFAFSDGTDTTEDADDRINWAVENRDDGIHIKRNLRRLVAELVDGDDGGWEWVGREFNLDADQTEAYEHWIVSGWLAGKLEERGHITGEFAGLTIWGRCTTGQAISMDGVIKEIAAELWANELAEVKEDEE